MPVGISLLNEVLVTITPIGPDTSATRALDLADTANWPASPGPTTVKIDRMRIQRSRTLVDHSTAQDLYDNQRIVKSTFVITLDTKLQNDGAELSIMVATGSIVGLSCTAQKASFTVPCLVESFDVSLDNPCTLSMTLRSIGVPIDWDTNSDFTP
jgi:hypothetical protein